MAAAGGARLLRAASVALGGAAYRWLLHARPLIEASKGFHNNCCTSGLRKSWEGRYIQMTLFREPCESKMDFMTKAGFYVLSQDSTYGCNPWGDTVGGLDSNIVAISCRAVELPFCSEDKITVHFVNRDGETLTAKGKVGDSLLDVVVENNLDIDGFGACEGTLACSTCHLIFEDHIFEKLDAVTDEENDMLDLAYGLTDRSRLGCQICLTKSMDNMTVRVPDVVADARQSIDVGKNS
ncbi:adrenodoxin, mitochondrial [Herpailurus yagouaroundi]|uniref:adrenodoxin, mitochondrial n=1 Tax=Herpailurus yagouaroundi TaxID=1608482 RepID=UPI001AD72FD8|nr:adrenodoxin, mitochondrial [Puma yagouaroundi]